MRDRLVFGLRVLREAAVYALGLSASAFFQFLALPLFTRELGPDAYGIVALTMAISGAVSAVLLVGGDVVLARFWFDVEERERGTLVVTWIGFLTAWSCIAVSILLVIVELGANRTDASQLSAPVLVALIALVPAQASRMLAQVLRNEFRPVPMALTGALTGLVSIACGLWFVLTLHTGPIGVFAGLLVGESVGCLLRLPLVADKLRGRPVPSLLPRLLRFGLPFLPATLAMWVFTGTDRIALSWWRSPADLAGYSVAATVVLPFTLVVVALGQAWIPRIVQLFEHRPDAARTAAGGGLELSLIGFGAAAMVVGLSAPIVVPVLAGAGYESGVTALPLLALGGAWYGTTLFAATGYTLAKRSALVPLVTGVAAAVNVALLALLVPPFGVVGAASAVSVSYFVLTCGMLAYSQFQVRVPLNPYRVVTLTLTLVGQAAVATAWPGTALTAAVTAGGLAILGLVGVRLLLELRTLLTGATIKGA